MSKLKIKPVSDYILITPDKPKGGAFDAGATYINETGTIEAIGNEVSDKIAKLVGKKVLFNAWACDEKTIGGERFYLTTESANAICATI